MSSALTCQFCTFINARGSAICLACGRTLGLPKVNLNPTGIACPTCTFENPVGNTICQICQAQIVGQANGTNMPAVDFLVNLEDDMSTTMAVDIGALCQICVTNMTQDFKMPGCTHTFCTPCAKNHFSIKIVECGINNVHCPIDNCSVFDELTNKLAFFEELKTVLRPILEPNVRMVLKDKVRILGIMDKPGFIRCTMCNHGFINKSKIRKTTCPDCFETFCSKCGRKWITGHISTTCKPNNGNGGTNDDGTGNMHTNATCPKCKHKYFLERGGCMHITCSQCSYEYCEFCFKKITGKGQSCDFPKCTKGQALHGHHPRNCMYYVRDMDHVKLELLLKNNAVRYTVVQKQRTSTCKLKVNVFSDGIWNDAECGKPALKSFNHMCLTHYKWHLGELMKMHKIDPVDVMNNLECMCELKRNNLNLANSSESLLSPIEDYRTPALRDMVRLHIPFEEILQ